MDVVWLLLRATIALACVLGLIWWGARRLTSGRVVRSSSEPHVMVVDRHALARGSGVAVLAIGNRRLLVGFGDQQVNLLSELAPVVTPIAISDLDDDEDGEAPRGRWTGRIPGRTPPEPGQRSRLAGSILHPQTWKDAMRALQDKTVRR
ncbi:MAG: flagellar biosynthetic protein FliO [Micrococcales bacterium]|nr:flagellar biosynthetic protein FliO [Micrococcales bacterium]